MKTTTKSRNVFCKLTEAKILLKKKKFCQLLKTLSHKTKKFANALSLPGLWDQLGLSSPGKRSCLIAESQGHTGFSCCHL